MKHYRVFVLLLILLLSACGSEAAVEPPQSEAGQGAKNITVYKSPT